MRKLLATGRAYIAGRIIEPGEIVNWPHPNTPDWLVDPRASTAPAPDAPADEPEPIEPVIIPEDWRSLKAPEKRALASKISREPVANARIAEDVIEQHLEANKPEAFGDAPAPASAGGNGVQESLEGGPAPDWLPPGASDEPVPADD